MKRKWFIFLLIFLIGGKRDGEDVIRIKVERGMGNGERVITYFIFMIRVLRGWILGLGVIEIIVVIFVILIYYGILY